MSEHETLTLALTGRSPVTIVKENWPILAKSRWQDGEISSQSDTAGITVRQHKDGRTLVTWYYSSQWANRRHDKGGELLPPGCDVPAAIRRAAELAGPEALLQECLSDLPAEEIV